MTGKINIEVMVDTNVNSRHTRKTSEREGENGAESLIVNRQLRDFREYLRRVHQQTGLDITVSQRDTAQLYHEKTHALTPELAKQAGLIITPTHVREMVNSDHYHVEPPTHGEQTYYKALRELVYAIQNDQEPGKLEKEGYRYPSQIDDLKLQELYNKHIRGMPRNSPYRKKPFEKLFTRYNNIRFNLGEATAVHFLENHPVNSPNERTVVVFVSSDTEALRRVSRVNQAGKKNFRSFSIRPHQLASLFGALIQQIETEHPECAQLRHDLAGLELPDDFSHTAPQKRAGRASAPEEEFAGFILKPFGKTELVPPIFSDSPLVCDPSQPPPPPLRIEVTLDSGIGRVGDTKALAGEKRFLRSRLGNNQALEDAKRFLREVKARTGWDISLIQRDPSQIFYEKTGYLNLEGPEALAQQSFGPQVEKLVVGKDRRFADLAARDEYQVDPPGAAEHTHLRALRALAFDYLQHSHALRKAVGEADSPEALTDKQLQIFVTHFHPPLNSPYRETEAFKTYTATVARLGESALSEMLYRFTPPENGGRVVHMVVSSEAQALDIVATAAKDQSEIYQDKIRLLGVPRGGLKRALDELVEQVKKEYPACADIAYPAPESHVQKLQRQKSAEQTRASGASL